jgi:hypothetical protein
MGGANGDPGPPDPPDEDPDPTDSEDAEKGAGASDEGGCSCNLSKMKEQKGAPLGVWLLLLSLLGVAKRRRNPVLTGNGAFSK